MITELKIKFGEVVLQSSDFFQIFTIFFKHFRTFGRCFVLFENWRAPRYNLFTPRVNCNAHFSISTFRLHRGIRSFVLRWSDNSCGYTRPFAHGKVRLYPREVCVLCVTSIPTETAHGKSLWIHKKEQKNYPCRFPNQVVGFSSGLSNHKSSSTSRMEENGKSGNRSTCWAFLWCCAEIAANILASTKFKTRGIKHGQLSRFTLSIFYSSLLWILQ